MLLEILILILVTFIPFLELRASIPLGILAGNVEIFNLTLQGFGLNWPLVFLVCVISNMVLGIIIYFVLNKFIHHLLKFKFFNKYYTKKVEKTQKKIKPYVNRFGLFGVALFIGIPLPGSGSYTGALAAYLLGLDYKRFILANMLGVVIAGIAVTILTLVSIGIFNLF